MAFNDLTLAWRTELSQYYKLPKPVIEVIIDPDGHSIELTSFYGAKYMSPLVNHLELSPQRMETLELSDLQFTFNDPAGFYNPWCLREISPGEAYYRPFRAVSLVLDEIPTATEAVFAVSGRGRYAPGDLVVFTDGENEDTVLVKEVATNSDKGYDRHVIIYEAGSLLHSYAVGDTTAIKTVTGLDVLVRLRLDGVAGRLELFRGVIRNPFQWELGQATLPINNRMAEFLQKEIRLHASSTSPTQRTDSTGSLSSSLSWNDGSSGTCSGVTTYTGAQIGLWEVMFSDATNFTVDGPNCKSKAGTTAADFYDQTDATDSQIYIPSGNWGGTPADDDVLSFYVSANFENKTVPEIIYELLHNYAGVSDDYIDVGGTGVTDTSEADTYSFNKAYNLIQGETISISFYTSMTLGEAIIMTGAHSMAYLTQMTGGNFRLFIMSHDYQFNAFWPIAGVDENEIIDIQAYRTDYINEFVIKYGWDYSNEEYQYTYTYPPSDNQNESFRVFDKKRTHTVEMPGIYAEADAEVQAKRLYYTWFMGASFLRVTGSLYFANLNIGDRIDNLVCGYSNYTESGNKLNGLVTSVSKAFIAQNRVEFMVWIFGADNYGVW